MTRLAALRKLMDQYWIEMPDDGQHTNSNTEDLAAYLDGHEPIREWAAVTAGINSSGYTIHYIYADFDTPEAAQRRASEHAYDDIYVEWPVAVVNLDTGVMQVPDKVVWRDVATTGREAP